MQPALLYLGSILIFFWGVGVRLGAVMKRLSLTLAIIGAAFAGFVVVAQEQPPPKGPLRVVPTGLVLKFAVGPLTENDVYIPKYPGEIPYKVQVEVRHGGLGVGFRTIPIHIYPGETIDRRQKLQNGHELVWQVTLSADASWADASFVLRHPDQIVLQQTISVHLPPHDG